MFIEVVKSKLHKVTVTEANLQYVGSITIDEALLEAANMIENEKVQIVNINNGERFETYIIKGERNSGIICLNGPAARKCAVGDVVIIISYASMDFEEAKSHKPTLVFPDTATNKLIWHDYLPFIEKKIAYSAEEASNILNLWKFKNDKIVFTNGCFDILHKGHIEYLAKARSLGTKLIIGLNTDASVKRLKGDSRPVNDEKARALLLASLIFVDEVILFDTDTPRDLIEFIQPDVLVKGGDYKPEDIVGYNIVKNKGGEVVTIDFIEGYSTTSTIEKMK